MGNRPDADRRAFSLDRVETVSQKGLTVYGSDPRCEVWGNHTFRLSASRDLLTVAVEDPSEPIWAPRDMSGIAPFTAFYLSHRDGEDLAWPYGLAVLDSEKQCVWLHDLSGGYFIDWVLERGWDRNALPAYLVEEAARLGLGGDTAAPSI